MQREYVHQRKNDIAGRITIVVQFTILWLVIVLMAMGKLGFLQCLIGIGIILIINRLFSKWATNKQPWILLVILIGIASWNGMSALTVGWQTFLRFLSNLIILYVTEFSFEFVDSKLKIRSNGKYGEVPYPLAVIVWPIAAVLNIFGIKNQPVLAYAVLIGLVAIPAIIFNKLLIFELVYDVCIAVCLYCNRKANK